MQPNTLIQDLLGRKPVVEVPARSDLTDPVFVEKLASAVDFICDNFPSAGPVARILEKRAEASSVVSGVSDLSERIRVSLMAKLQEKQKLAESNDSDLVQSVMGKLLRMRTEAVVPQETEEPETVPEKTAASQEDDVAEHMEGGRERGSRCGRLELGGRARRSTPSQRTCRECLPGAYEDRGCSW